MERERWGRDRNLPIVCEELMEAARDCKRVRLGKELWSPLTLVELVEAQGLVQDTENRVLRPSCSNHSTWSHTKATTEVSFKESLFKKEWRAL